MNKTFLRLFASVATGILLLTACNKTDDTIFATIPSDATIVAVMDGEKILANAGISPSGDTSSDLPPRVRELFGGQFMQALMEVSGTIDMKNVVMYATRGDIVTTALIKDEDKFRKSIEKATKAPESRDGYDVYVGRMVTLVKDGQVWMSEGSVDDVIEAVDGMAEKARENNFREHTGLVDALCAGKDASFVVNSSAFTLPDNDAWIAGDLNLESQRAMLTLRLMRSDGEIITTDILRTVDTDFLRYVPGDFNFAAAVGIAKAAQVAEWASLAARMMTFRERSILESVIPFLSKVNGTVAVAARLTPDDESRSPLALPALLVMARMEQADVNASVQSLVEMAKGMRASVTEERGIYHLTAPGTDLYIGNVDGMLGISTVPFEDTRNNNLNTRFLSRLGGLSMDIPAGWHGDFNIPVTVTANLQQEQAQIEVVFPDTKGPFLKTYLEAAANL